jgi:hypothetical protein
VPKVVVKKAAELLPVQGLIGKILQLGNQLFRDRIGINAKRA